jgi:hypothetical protein
MTWFSGVLGKNASTKLAVDPTQFAARVSGRPMELGTRGSYALAWESGIMAAGLGGNSEIFQMRWVDASRFCLIRSIIFNASRNTTAFATGVASFRLNVARSWSADGGAGAAVVFSTNNTNKRRTDFPLSLFSDTGVRGSQTAALTAGTKTLDTNPIAAMNAFISTGATSVPDPYIIPPGAVLWQRNTHDEYPILLEQNEGIVIRATVPATGTWQFSVNVEWAELDPSAVDGWA